VFVVDPKTGATAENRALWKFVRQIVAGLDLGKGNVRVRFVRDCLDVPEIHLDRFLDKTQLLDELSQRRGDTSPTPELIRRMTLKLKDVDGDKPANSVLKRRKVSERAPPLSPSRLNYRSFGNRICCAMSLGYVHYRPAAADRVFVLYRSVTSTNAPFIS